MLEECLRFVRNNPLAEYREDDGPWLPLSAKRARWTRRKAWIENWLSERFGST